MKTQTSRHILFALSIASALLSACAKSSDSSSTSAAAGSSTAQASTSNASCNSFLTSDQNLGGRIATYYLNNNFVEDELRVRITNMSSSFDSSNLTLEFFRWKADSSGTATYDNTPLTFTIFSGTTAISSAMTSINSTEVANLRSTSGIGTSSQDFFARTTIVVGGVDNSWQVLQPVLYNGSAAVEQTNALMPLFAANPATYASAHPAVLNQLHPFYSQTSSTNTDAYYVNLSNQLCFQ